MVNMTGGEALAAQLIVEGVHDVFGVPGVQLDYALDGLARHPDKIRFFNTRHEQGAAYMADGYARATGDVGVCMVVPGPGVLNAGAGLATAFACSSRVLCIAGQLPSWAIERHLGLLHEVPGQSQILASVTKWSTMARTPEQIPAAVRAAFRELRSGRPRPVAVEIPPDVLQATCDVELIEPDPDEAGRTPADTEQLGLVAEALRGAARPVIYAGGGVVSAVASAELRQLAERLDSPVVLSRGGRGALSDRHRLALSSVAGRRVIPHADVVLVVGSRFTTTMGAVVPTLPTTTLLGMNVDVNDLGPPRPYAHTVVCDAQLGLSALADLIGPRRRDPAGADELNAARLWAQAQCEAVVPQNAWLRSLRAAIPDDGLLVNELTQVGYLANVAYPVFTERAYIAPGYQGTLGYGFPTALGAKAAHPHRPVVSITGDGGFGWCMSELSTARKYGLGVVTVIFNDAAFGNVRRTQHDTFANRYIGSDLVNPDFVALGHAFGVHATRVSTPAALQAELSNAIAVDQPALIEVTVGEMPSAWHLIMEVGEIPPSRTVCGETPGVPDCPS